MRNAADSIKGILTAKQAAEHYGLEVNRAGFLRCPFHSDDTASLKLFPDGGWKCFGCGKGGSVIDFVMELFNLSFRQAVLRIDSDFRLGLTMSKPSREEQSAILARKRKEQREKDAKELEFLVMIRDLRYYQKIVEMAPPVRDGETVWFHPIYVEAVKRLPYINYWLDEYFSGGELDAWKKKCQIS
jgi:DNA primase (bacterial type)